MFPTVITIIFVPFKIIRGSSIISEFSTKYFKMNYASNAFTLCAIHMIFLKHFVVRVTRLTNCLTTFRNINSRTPHQRSYRHILYSRTNLVSTQRICTFSFPSHVSSCCVSKSYEEHEWSHDAISFVFIIYSTFGLILVPAYSFILYRRTFSQILGNDFTSKKAHKAKMIRKPLPSASFTICCFAYVSRF